jgi:TonB family protein
MKTGILQCMNNGMISSLLSSTGDICAKGGYSDKIDAILSGAGGLKTGGASSAGRRGAAGIGNGNGYGSGYGGGSGQESVNEMLNNLMAPGSGTLVLKKHTGKIELSLSNPSVLHPLIGGRSRASIMLVVQQNLQALRYAYNKRLQEKPGLKGKIMIRFAIDEFGKVIFCDIAGSSLPDRGLEQTVVSQIRSWVFDKIDKPGDVTEVEYPFVFSL